MIDFLKNILKNKKKLSQFVPLSGNCKQCKKDYDLKNPCDCKERGCSTCGGMIGVPGRVYGYAGKWCDCHLTGE